MAIHPFTLNKLDPIVIKQVEFKVVSGIVHEMKGAEVKKENNSNNNPSFNQQNQERAAQQFAQFLSTLNLKMEHRIEKNKVKFRIKDKKGNLIFESEVDDIEVLYNNVTKNYGNFIDIKV